MTRHVYYIGRTDTGYKVEHRNHAGFAEGLFTKDSTRYFYGENALGDAEDYAHKKANEKDSAGIKRHPTLRL